MPNDGLPQPIIDAETRAMFAAMSQPVPEVAPEPVPVPTPTPEPEAAVDIDAFMESLKAQQDAALAKLDEVASKFTAQERAEGSEEEEDQLLARLAEENPEAAHLVRVVAEQQKQIEALAKKVESKDLAEQFEQQVEEIRSVIVSGAKDLLVTHNLTDEQLKATIEWYGDEKNAAAAGTLSFREAAGRALGHDTLEALRRREAAPSGPAKPGAPAASKPAVKIVTESGPGAGSVPGGGNGQDPQGGAGDEIRSATRGVLQEYGHLLGKHG